MPAKTWHEVEEEIKEAVASGLLLDKRSAMPRGVVDGKTREWRKRDTPADVLGVACHQSAGRNTSDPRATGRYHTSITNHITPGRPLPSLCYHIAITDAGDAWLCGDLSWRVYGQGAKEKDHPGDENRHLLSLLVLGAFHGLGWRPQWSKPKPTDAQLAKLPKVLRWLMDIFDFGGEGVFGHYHFGKSACPGYTVTEWIEECRAKDDKAELATTQETQEALLRWLPSCLPKYGADNDFGGETRAALLEFQRFHGIMTTGRPDPFTELVLLQRYTDPELAKGGLRLEGGELNAQMETVDPVAQEKAPTETEKPAMKRRVKKRYKK